ncbi:MAG TPA: hypothetical protein VK790_11495 [Solirubrobacteraceae bacterium]|nr:hypothetical protein [Solirubrobacteraceae bacterium]
MSWVALAALWVWQLDVYVPSDWLGGVELILALLAGWTCFSVMWVAWCRNIYRRRHRRTSPLKREVNFERDALERRIVAPPGIAATRGQVVISVDEAGVKRYQLVEPRAPRQASSVRRDSRHVEERRPRLIA